MTRNVSIAADQPGDDRGSSHMRTAVLIAACALFATPALADPMAKDSGQTMMKKDSMSKQPSMMKKDSMSKQPSMMKKDSMSKDSMSKDSMSKDPMAK